MIVNAVDFFSAAPVPSLTSISKEKFPLAVGAPEIMPVDDASDNPGGKLPELTLQKYCEVPPVASNVATYGVPTTADGKTCVAMAKGVEEEVLCEASAT